jgi:hypothetical protein
MISPQWVYERTEPIDLANWPGDLTDNAFVERFAATLDAGELWLFDPATSEARPVVRRETERP